MSLCKKIVTSERLLSFHTLIVLKILSKTPYRHINNNNFDMDKNEKDKYLCMKMKSV